MTSAPQVRDAALIDEVVAPDSYALSQTLRALESPPTSATAIALHNLAAEIMAQQVGAGRRGLVVCGPSRGGGVSFVATNLAIALGQLGLSVLLVDANLHEPAVNLLIAPSAPPLGLGDLISREDLSLDDVIHRDALPGLSILYAGAASPEASEQVSSARCDEVLRECMRDFDYTVVDSPPANRAADARRLASIVGYAMIVACQDTTYVDDIATLSAELSEDGTTVVAGLLNQV